MFVILQSVDIMRAVAFAISIDLANVCAIELAFVRRY